MAFPLLSSFLIHTNASRLLRILLQMLLTEESGFHTHCFKGRSFYLSLSLSLSLRLPSCTVYDFARLWTRGVLTVLCDGMDLIWLIVFKRAVHALPEHGLEAADCRSALR